jgi:hypothetical protein
MHSHNFRSLPAQKTNMSCTDGDIHTPDILSVGVMIPGLNNLRGLTTHAAGCQDNHGYHNNKKSVHPLVGIL